MQLIEPEVAAGDAMIALRCGAMGAQRAQVGGQRFVAGRDQPCVTEAAELLFPGSIVPNQERSAIDIGSPVPPRPAACSVQPEFANPFRCSTSRLRAGLSD